MLHVESVKMFYCGSHWIQKARFPPILTSTCPTCRHTYYALEFLETEGRLEEDHGRVSCGVSKETLHLNCWHEDRLVYQGPDSVTFLHPKVHPKVHPISSTKILGVLSGAKKVTESGPRDPKKVGTIAFEYSKLEIFIS